MIRRWTGSSTGTFILLLREMLPVLIVLLAGWALTASVSPSSVLQRDSRETLSNNDCVNGGANETCGERYCLCNRERGIAVCSGFLFGPVTYIPEFSFVVRLLCFIEHNLTYIRDEHFFKNVTSVTMLDMRYDDLMSIRAGVFSLLKNLTHLYLRFNPEISHAAVSDVLSISTLKHLSLENCNLGRISSDIFQNVTLPRLRYLNLAQNEIEHLNLSEFTSLTKLKHIDLGSNRLLHIPVISVLWFRHLDLSSNYFSDFPQTCDVNGISLFPKLQTLVLENNVIESLPAHVCLPQLRSLDLSGNSLVVPYPSPFNGRNFPLLRELDLSYNYDGALSLDPDIFTNMTRLKAVDFRSNNMLVTAQSIQDSFVNCPEISQLYFGDNLFLNRPATSGLWSLKTLELESCQIFAISSQTFCFFPQLRRLLLPKNMLYFLPDGAFNCLPNLTHLDLSYNRIHVVSPETFSRRLSHQLMYLDLSYNLFECSCQLLWFQEWMRRSPSVFYVDTGLDYQCKNIPNTTVSAFVLHEQACLFSHDTYVAMVSVLSLLLIVMTGMVVVCRYHWHLRLLCYEACRGPSHVRRRRLQSGHFLYDVFVSYDSEDFPWVRQHLVPELEGRLGLRLCLHERDFSAGYIIDNIVHSVESSKKIIMLFSRHFAQSRWCQFELSFCLRHVMEYEDALIVVCVDDVTSHDLTSGMTAVLKTTTYLQWEGGDGGNSTFFWQRLAVGLQEVLHGPQLV